MGGGCQGRSRLEVELALRGGVLAGGFLEGVVAAGGEAEGENVHRVTTNFEASDEVMVQL